ncbi:hypothetical protein ACO0QE_001008 [Hanseniaspora vineae]
MPKFTYKEVCSIGTGLILSGTFFVIGLITAQFPYDLPLLFDKNVTQQHFDNSLNHYQNLYYTPKYIMGIYIALYSLGMLGCLIRIYKPHPDLQMFEYGTLILYFLTVCVFLTNVKTGIDSCHYREWGEITENQGLAVIGSSNLIILIIISGVLILQIGLWWTNWDYQGRLQEFFAEEEKEANATAAAAAADATAKSTGSSINASSSSADSTTAKQTKSKDSKKKK